MLRVRLLLGTLMIATLVGLVLLDVRLASGLSNQPIAYTATPPTSANANIVWGLPTVIVAVLLAVFAAVEFAGILRQGGHRPIGWWAAVVSAGLVALPWVQTALWPTMTGQAPPDLTRPVTAIWLAGGLIGTCLLTLARRTTAGAISAIATTMLIITFIGLLGSFLVQIRCTAPGPAGAVLVLYTVMTIKSCDIGAYLLGRVFGRTPLAAWLSPKKTIEGFIGGLLLACGVAIGGAALWGAFGTEHLGNQPMSITQAIVFGVVMAIVGHLGDLTESAFKRDIGTKDSGAVVPAFGGFLDILDSPWFAAPVAWWLLTFFSAGR